jgi:hypothetical protein
MATVYKYRVRCIEDDDWEYVWSETEPTICPHNTSHTIDTSLTSIVDKVERKFVEVKEEEVPTGGHFQTESLVLTANANSTAVSKIYWPFDITALEVKFVTDDSMEGDVINMYGGKNMVTGAITGFVSPASAWTNRDYIVGEKVVYAHAYHTGPRVYTCVANTVGNALPVNLAIPKTPENLPYWKHGYEMPVTSSVTINTAIGYWHSITDGANTTDMGRVISINKETNKLYMENNPDNSYSPASPTYVKQTICFIKDYVVSKAAHRSIGRSKIGGASIPANIYVTGEYKNNSLDGNAKTLIGYTEILY